MSTYRKPGKLPEHKPYAYRGYIIREIPRYGWTITRDGYAIGSNATEQLARETVNLLTQP